ncbi:MAG: SDR family oxidoreductase [Polyangiaceae bacterium]
MNAPRKLAGKHAVITGGTTGIGWATAKLLHENGAAVMVTGKSEDSLDAARASLPADVEVLRSDACSLSDIDSLAGQVRRRWDGLDILFLNAGTARVAPFETVSEAFFDDLVSLNFKGAFFTLQRLRPLLRPGAAVIFNSSVASRWRTPATSVYSATKAALGALVRTLAAELAPQRIRVNAICPGLIETPIFGKLGLPPEAVQDMAAGLVGRVGAARTGTAAEIARGVLFLASDDSSYVVGEELVVDGGMAA